jgi:hypothetical protein
VLRTFDPMLSEVLMPYMGEHIRGTTFHDLELELTPSQRKPG